MTTTDELRDILNWPLMKSLHGQVCAKDKLPVGKKPLQVRAFIVNTDLAIDPGQHWVALYFKGNKAIYFDSYGLPPSKRPCPSIHTEQQFRLDRKYSNVTGCDE